MLPVDDQSVLRLYEAIRDHRRFLIIQPKGIDGDSMGCGMAWQHALKSLGKTVTHFSLSPVAEKFHFLEGWEEITFDYPDISQIDVAIMCDEGDLYDHSGFSPEQVKELQEKTVLVNIDHHWGNRNYGTVNVVVPAAAAACQLVTVLFRKLGIRVTPTIATALLLGHYTDTGSFQHDNTSADALDSAAWLTGRGGDAVLVARENFRVLPLPQLRLWGRVLMRSRQNELGIVSSYVNDEDFDELGATKPQLEGVVNYLNAVPNAPFSLLMSQRGPHLKGSLRTQRSDVDVSKIAGLYGGGGHKKASGFTVNNARLDHDGETRSVVPA